MMTANYLVTLLASAGALALAGGALAQSAEPDAEIEQVAVPELAPTVMMYNAEDSAPEAAAELSEDDVADMLNSSQQLQQTFTLKRTIDGTVVETEKRTVTYSRGQPYRETEAGRTALQKLQAEFDGEVLTRTEAFEEAKLDFTIADTDRNGEMTADEFIALVNSWRENDARQAEAPTQEVARQREFEAFLLDVNPEAAREQNQTHVREKFAFMSGAAQTVSREDYIREYLLDFDAMDTDKDTLLKAMELMRFRALNRGEALEM
jgi:hypothetical protein